MKIRNDKKQTIDTIMLKSGDKRGLFEVSCPKFIVHSKLCRKKERGICYFCELHGLCRGDRLLQKS
jgi:hypothetical protein